MSSSEVAATRERVTGSAAERGHAHGTARAHGPKCEDHWLLAPHGAQAGESARGRIRYCTDIGLILDCTLSISFDTSISDVRRRREGKTRPRERGRGTVSIRRSDQASTINQQHTECTQSQLAHMHLIFVVADYRIGSADRIFFDRPRMQTASATDSEPNQTGWLAHRSCRHPAGRQGSAATVGSPLQ